MKPSDRLIAESIRHLEQQDNKIVVNGKIPGVYKGYIASFGGTIVQSGILQACLAYWADKREGKHCRKNIMESMFKLYKQYYDSNAVHNELDDYLKAKWSPGQWTYQQKRSFRNRMAAIAVSLKIAMRTFEFEGDISTQETEE